MARPNSAPIKRNRLPIFTPDAASGSIKSVYFARTNSSRLMCTSTYNIDPVDLVPHSADGQLRRPGTQSMTEQRRFFYVSNLHLSFRHYVSQQLGAVLASTAEDIFAVSMSRQNMLFCAAPPRLTIPLKTVIMRLCRSSFAIADSRDDVVS